METLLPQIPHIRFLSISAAKIQSDLPRQFCHFSAISHRVAILSTVLIKLFIPAHALAVSAAFDSEAFKKEFVEQHRGHQAISYTSNISGIIDFTDGDASQPAETIDVCLHRKTDGFDVQFWLKRPPSGGATLTTVSRRCISTDTAIFYDMARGLPPTRANYTSRGQDYRWFSLAQMQGAEALEGYLARDAIPYWELVASGNAAVSRSSGPGAEEVTYKVPSDRGDYTITIDRNTRQLVRAGVTKSSQHIYDNNRLSQLPATKNGKTVLYTFEMQVLDSENVQGYNFIRSAEITETKVFENRTRSVAKKRFNRKSVDVAPDFNAIGAFKPALSENTPIRNIDAPAVKMVWRNGIVDTLGAGEAYEVQVRGALRSFDELRSAGASDARQVATSLWYPWIVFVAVVFLCAVLVFWFIVRRRWARQITIL